MAEPITSGAALRGPSWPRLDARPGPARTLDEGAGRELVSAVLAQLTAEGWVRDAGDAKRATDGRTHAAADGSVGGDFASSAEALPDAFVARPDAARSPARPPHMLRGIGLRWALAAGVVAFASAAVGGVLVAQVFLVREHPIVEREAELRLRRARTESARPVAEAAPPAGETALGSVPAEAPVAPTPALAAPPAPSTFRGRVAERRPEAAAASVRPALRAAVQDALAEANRLRGERRYAEAAAAYGRAARLVPGGREAYVAIVARAELLLERLGRPREARRLYRAALAARPRGPLLDEALCGLAESERLLGDPKAERVPLERLLRERPESPLRSRAEARLRELGE